MKNALHSLAIRVVNWVNDEIPEGMNHRVYSFHVSWFEASENLGIAVFVVTCLSRQVLIVHLPQVRSGSRRVEHTCPPVWLASQSLTKQRGGYAVLYNLFGSDWKQYSLVLPPRK